MEEQRLGTAEDAAATRSRDLALKLMMPVRVGGPKDAIEQARAASSVWEEASATGEAAFVFASPPPPPRHQMSQQYRSQPPVTSGVKLDLEVMMMMMMININDFVTFAATTTTTVTGST
jgi:hypothetical protein